MNRIGDVRYRAYSAGSDPTGQVNPYALALLNRYDYPTAGLRSKSWEEFAGPDAPVVDYVITVCDNAAGEVCPVWPGRPASAHWGFPDPAAFEGDESEVRAHFEDVYRQIHDTLMSFVDGGLDGVRLPIAEAAR